MIVATNGGEVRKRERERVVDWQREMVGIFFFFLVLLGLGLWLSANCGLSEFGDFCWSRDMHMVQDRC